MEETQTASGLLNEPNDSQERPSENSWFDGGADDLRLDRSIQAAAMDPMSLASQDLGQSYNQPGISSEVVSSQSSNFSTRLPPIPIQAAMDPLSLASSNLGQSLSESDLGSDPRKIRKRKIDKAFRERIKKQKLENESYIKDLEKISLMHQIFTDRQIELDRLRNDGLQLKRELEKQNVRVQTLSGLLGDNQPGISSEVVSSQNSNFSTRLPPIPKLKAEPMSLASPNLGQSLSESDPGSDPRKIRKREIDKASRERRKKQKIQNKSYIKDLKGENDSLKQEKESLKREIYFMNQTLTDQEKEIDQLRSALSQVKRDYEEKQKMYKFLEEKNRDQQIELDRLRNDLLQLNCEHEKQNVLVQALTGLIGDPMGLENEKLKDEIATLKKNAPLDSNFPQLAEENAKLRSENKVIRLQNEALYEKMIGDKGNKHENDH